VTVPRDGLSWQDSADVIGSAFSSPRHLGGVLGAERQYSVQAPSLQGLPSLSQPEALSEELFGSAANSPRSDNASLLGAGRHNLFRVRFYACQERRW
jgi:hypothetical protein